MSLESWQENIEQRNVFLHFLNRELNRSVGQDVPGNLYEDEIWTLLAALSESLFTNFANIIEGSYLKSDLIKELIKTNLLLFHGEKPTLEEYIETRPTRYKFDQHRYPDLFTGSSIDLNLRPNLVRQFSMTSKLKTKLFELNQERNDYFNLLVNYVEKDQYWKTINDLVDHKGSEALTMSLVNNLISNPGGNPGARVGLLNTVGRQLSIIYFNEIAKDINGDIPTGIQNLSLFDQYGRHFPEYDIHLLQALLFQCGVMDRKGLTIDDLINFRMSYIHSSSAHSIKAILIALHQVVAKKYQKRETQRMVLSNLMLSAIQRPASNITFHHLPERIDKLIDGLSRYVPNLKELLMSNDRLLKTILVITATQIESRAILDASHSHFGSTGQTSVIRKSAVTYLGTLSKYKVYHCQCEPGSVGPGASLVVAMDLIEALKPSIVLMPGIAFGLKTQSQKEGDILVGQQLLSYEKQRVGTKTISRGDKVSPSPMLLSVLKHASLSWTKSKVHFGLLMSGEKLVDNLSFRQELIDMEPEAIGGEMEGAGIYSAAYRSKVDWIVFKAIVDWGTGKNDGFHDQGARNVAEFLFKVLPILDA